MFPEIYQWFRRLFRLKCYETIFEDRFLAIFDNKIVLVLATVAGTLLPLIIVCVASMIISNTVIDVVHYPTIGVLSKIPLNLFKAIVWLGVYYMCVVSYTGRGCQCKCKK